MRFVAGMVAVAAIAGSGVIGSAMASNAGSTLCTGSDKVCIYDDLNWVGLLGSRSTTSGAQNVSTGANDKTSSWENERGTGARWYTDANSSGTCRSMPANSEDSYVGDTYNDKLTSWATNGTC